MVAFVSDAPAAGASAASSPKPSSLHDRASTESLAACALAVRSNWEASMQVFGIAADVDAMSRKRRVAPAETVSTRTDSGRRAAQYGDIVDLQGRRHYSEAAKQPSQSRGQRANGLEAVDIDSQQSRRKVQSKAATKKVANGVLPFDAESYEMHDGARPGHQYFDGSSRSLEYAELIGRPRAAGHMDECVQGALFELLASAESGRGHQGLNLPLALRRVLASTLPAESNPDFRGKDGERLRDLVGLRVAEAAGASTLEAFFPEDMSAFGLVGTEASQGHSEEHASDDEEPEVVESNIGSARGSIEATESVDLDADVMHPDQSLTGLSAVDTTADSSIVAGGWAYGARRLSMEGVSASKMAAGKDVGLPMPPIPGPAVGLPTLLSGAGRLEKPRRMSDEAMREL